MTEKKILNDKTMSLKDLDVTSQCEQGFEFEYINNDGKKTGIFLTIIGAHAPQLKSWIYKTLNKRKAAEAIAEKRGNSRPIAIEEDIEFGAESVARRITGWRGITEPFTAANALQLVEINPLIFEQVREHSENLANFMKSK